MYDLARDYDLVAVADGAMALALVELRSVALVLTDYRMPDMDGVALTSAIKTVAPQCPVVLMTAYATPEVEQRGHAAGADFFLAKPFPLSELEVTVRAALAC